MKAGYATVSTYTGHSTNGGSFALGHPEKLIDFSWRSEHEMTVKAKALVEAYYGNPPRRSYWNGCSTGGRQALKEAQMFPADFDGIIAGAPTAGCGNGSVAQGRLDQMDGQPKLGNPRGWDK